MAHGLARRGVTIALHHNSNTKNAESIEQDIRAIGVKCVSLQANLLEEIKPQSQIGCAQADLALDLDVLINSASVFKQETNKSATRASWDMNLNNNLRAPLILSQQIAKQYRQCAPLQRGEKILKISCNR